MLPIWNVTFVAAAADDGDDFSDNLLSDLAPLLALFGERATMQFMSQSMGWADNIILAMAPLGIITALVSAIRVGGPKWLKGIIGRARENLAAAEVELMSSTSKEVSELWNGQQVVRCMGASDVTEFICLLQTAWENKTTADQDYLTEIDPSDFQTQPHQWRGKNTAEKDLERDSEQTQGQSSSQPNPLSQRIIFLRNNSAPNILLNIHRQFTRWELYIAALFGTILQLAILVYSWVVTYHLKWKKNGAPIAEYAYPCNIFGTVFLVTGMVLCGHVVESSTEEKSYEATVKGTETSIFWLQKQKTVNDQAFDSFAIWARDRKYITKSKRTEGGRLDTGARSVSEPGSEISQGDPSRSVFNLFSIEFQKGGTVAIQPIKEHSRINGSEKSTNQTGTNTRSKRLMRWVTRRMSVFGTAITLPVFSAAITLPVFSAAITLCGFILQFIGLRGLHWSSSVFQLAAVLFMTGLRALVRHELEDKVTSRPLDPDFQLEWFALKFGDPTKLFSSPTNAQEEFSKHFEEKAFKDWRVVAETPTDRYRSLEEMEMPKIKMEKGILDAYGVMKIRRQLGVLADWRGPASTTAISLKKAIETTMNTIFALHSCSEFIWSLEVFYGSKPQTIYFKIKRLKRKWEVDSGDIDAALSLWLYSTNDQDKEMHPYPEDQPTRSRLYNDVSQLDGKDPSAKQNLQLLGPCTDSLDQDLKWWLPTDAARVIQVTETTSKNASDSMKIESHRVVGCGGKQQDISQWKYCPRFRFFNTPKNDKATCDSQPSLLAIESIGPLQLLYSQQMFSAFMWSVAKTLKDPIEGGVTIQPIGIESGQDGWKAFTLRNDKLHKMVLDICNTGLGNLVQIYLAIIPPLSAENKLPELDNIVDLAQEKAKPHEQARHWESVADIYQWLVKTVTKFSQDRFAAHRATAMLMEYLDRVTRNIDLRKAQKYRDQDVQLLEGVQARLKETLESVSQPVKEQLQAYKQKARDRAVGILQRRIVTSTADVEQKDIYDWTILHYAATQEWKCWKNWEIQERWDDFKFDINAQDLQGRTPLHCASMSGNNEVVKALLRRGARGDTQCMDGISPFHHAVNKCEPSVVKSFVEAGTSIDVRDRLGQTPLFWAAFQGKVKVVEDLWLKVNQELKDDEGRVALHLALMGGNITLAEWLLKKGVDKEARDNESATSLHMAARSGHEAVVRYLVETAGVDKEARDNDNWTSLHRAAHSGHETVVRYLVETAGVDKEARDNSGWTSLHRAADSGHEVVVRYLVGTARVDKEARDNFGLTALHAAVIKGHEAVVRYLVETAGVDKEGRDNVDWTPLHRAADSGHGAVVRCLVETAGVDKEARDKFGLTSLHRAAHSGHEAVVRYLVETAKVDKEARDNDNWTSLHWSAHSGHETVVQYLVETATVDKEARDNSGWTSLHRAAHSGHKAVVRYLVENAKVDKEARDNDDWTSLHLAADSGHEAVVRYLVETAGVDKEARDKDCWTSLHLAAHSGHEAVVRYLVETAEVDKEARDSFNWTSLHRAADSGHEAVVRYLVETAKVDKEARDSFDWTSLHRAADSGHGAVVRYLVETAGVDKEARDKFGLTSLHRAAHSGHEAVVRYLVETAKVDKEARDNSGWTSLHRAADSGHEAVVRYLIEKANVDKNSQDGLNETALHKAVRAGHQTIVQYLLEEAMVDKSIRNTSNQMASEVEVVSRSSTIRLGISGSQAEVV